ncbi:MAG: protein kinase [Verrucomicrobiota bacterium]
MESRANDLFAAALELEAEERDAYLAEACGSDAQLHLEVMRLLVDAERADAFFGDDDGATLGAEEFADRFSEKEGDEIGPYTLRKLLGEGGFGSVWMAEQKVPISRLVALKVVKAGMDTRQVLARFEAERQALARMDHPNIARVLDAGATRAGRPFFAMELVHGMPITRYCDEVELGTRERLELFRDVCSAINHAHQKGIIHRDIKPSNVMVNPSGGNPLVKVIDFGIAKATRGKLTDQTMLTRVEQFVGTPVYMSPEQAAMSSLDVDTRSDIYSLGILLYELLTGKPPFDAETLASSGYDEMRRIIQEQEPAKPSSRIVTVAGSKATEAGKTQVLDRRRLIEPDLDWVVMKAIEKDRDRRYETANAFSEDIARFLADEPVSARPPSTLYQFQKFARRNRTGLRVAAGIAGLLVTGTLVSSWLAVRATRAERISNAALEELRATAPAFGVQARALAAKEQFDEAIEKLDYALKLQPDSADFLVAKADLLQCQFKLEQAEPVYRAAMMAKPDSNRARESAALCAELRAAPRAADGKLTRESLVKLQQLMQAQNRPVAEIMPVARLLGEESDLLKEYWITRLADLPLSAEIPLERRVTFREDGLLALDLSNSKITDLTPIVGMPLGSLDLSSCSAIADFTALHSFSSLKKLDLRYTNVTDLAPLAGLPLEWLSLGGTQVLDLTPLTGIKIRHLNLRNTWVQDLTPLAGMPLNHLDAAEIPANDFSPLRGAPLETCLLLYSALRNLSFLQDAPLTELDLSGCLDVEHYRVLSSLKSLGRLVLPSNFRYLPEADLDAISELRHHPTLKSIQTDWQNGSFLLDSERDKAAFWKSWDRERQLVKSLVAVGIRHTIRPFAGGGLSLIIKDQPFSDLSLLKDSSIRALTISGTQVSNLRPLEDLPLVHLDIRETPVTDLSPLRSPVLSKSLQILEIWRIPAKDFSPLTACTNLILLDAAETALTDLSVLKGLKLKTLLLGGAAVTDISVLAGMPLERVSLARTGVNDLRPLLECPTLTEATVPESVPGIERMRELPQLTKLSFTEINGGFSSQSATDFWLKHDHDGITAAVIPQLVEKSGQNPSDTLLALRVAAIQAWFGENSGHAEFASKLMDKADASGLDDSIERAAKAASLSSTGDATLLSRALAMAREAARTEGNAYQRPWYQQTLGMVEYRAGNDEAALAAFAQAEQASVKDDWEPALRRFIRVPCGFYRAMILWRQGKLDEARTHFAAAEREMDVPPEKAAELLPLDVTQDQLVCWLAHREAKAMMQL